MEWVNALVQGLLLGGLYALLACGLSLVFGVMRTVNIAHGDLAVLAAFLGLIAVERTGLHPLVTILGVVPVMAAAGYALQRGLLGPALARGEIAPLLVTFGLAVVVQNLLQELFSADSRRLAVAKVPRACGSPTTSRSAGCRWSRSSSGSRLCRRYRWCFRAPGSAGLCALRATIPKRPG